MSEPLLRILSIGFLTLLYLFFLRVLWITRSQLKAPRTAAKPAPSARKPAKSRAKSPRLSLTITDPPELRGRTYQLTESTTIGRAEGAGIVLIDDFISQFHARISVIDGSYALEDLGSTNGTYRESQRITQAEPLLLGDTFRIGAITFEMTPATVTAEGRS